MTCHVAVDGTLVHVKYGGKPLEFSGDGSDWTSTKKFKFVAKANQSIEINASRYDGRGITQIVAGGSTSFGFCYNY